MASKTRRSLSNFVVVFDARVDNPSCNGSSYVSPPNIPFFEIQKTSGSFLRPVSSFVFFSWLEAPEPRFRWLDNAQSLEINSGVQSQ